MNQSDLAWRSAARAKLVLLKTRAETLRSEVIRLGDSIVALRRHATAAENVVTELVQQLAFASGERAAKLSAEIAERRADLEQMLAALAASHERLNESRIESGHATRLAQDATDAAVRIGLISPEEGAA